MKKVLVIDIGGSHVKLMMSREEKRKFESGPKIKAKQLVAQVLETAEGWDFDAVSVGFPAAVRDGKIIKEPTHLAGGWVGYDLAKSLGKPTRIINDAALQALGSYEGSGRMLFLGLGTGLGSALVWERNVLSLELGHLPYGDGYIIEDFLGKSGMQDLGKKTWRHEVLDAVEQLRVALIADYVTLGGGNAKQFDELPKGLQLGHNRNAYLGGRRLWEEDPKTHAPKWRIL